MAASDASPFPIKNQAYRVTFPILDADGDLVTGATGLDSEVSLDGGTFSDCTSEATEIATSSGMYYLDLTAAEMNADTVAVIVKTTSTGAKTTPMVLYPVTLTEPMLAVNVEQWNNTAVPAEHTSGYPIVTIKDGTGTGEIDTSSGTVTVGTNNDKTGYSLTQAFPTNFSSMSITATGAVGLNWGSVENAGTTVDLSATSINLVDTTTTNTDMRGTDNALLAASAPTNFGDLSITVSTGRVDVNALGGDATALANLQASATSIVTGQASAGTLSTTQMTTNLAEATDNHYIGRLIIWTSGVLLGQATNITDYAGSGGLLTFEEVTEAPSASDTFVIL